MNKLHPEDYGLLGMVYPIFLFCGLISNFAIDRSIITRTKISSDELSTLIWLKLAFSLLIAIILLLLKSPVISFYGEPKLGLIIDLLALVVIIQSVIDIYKGILYRRFSFKAMALSEISAILLSGTLALILAHSGWSYKALLAKEIALSSLLLIFIGISTRWLPKFIFHKSIIKNHWSFGKNITAARILNYFSRNLDDILVGRKFGSGSLGLYTKSYALLTLPLTLISKTFVTAVLPSMPHFNKQPNEANNQYKKVARSVLALNTPLCLIVFFTADDLINLILPGNWIGTVPLIQLFCILSIFQAIGPLNDLVYEGMDKSEKIVRYTIICHMITISGILLGFTLGNNIFELALFYVIGNFITFVVNQYFIAKIIKLSFRTLLQNMTPYFVCGVITFGFTYIGIGFLDHMHPISKIFITSIFILFTYFGLIYLLFQANFDEIKSAVFQLITRAK
jgi:PST family polysaccharide transporter